MELRHLVVFLHSRPFERFVISTYGGREIDVSHPESVMMTKLGTALWITSKESRVEVIKSDAIASMRTKGPVDPVTFIGSAGE